MKAIQAADRGGYDALRLVDIPWPQPRAGQALVRVTSAGVTPLDRTVLAGLHPSARKLPLVPGNEGAGTSAALPGEIPDETTRMVCRLGSAGSGSCIAASPLRRYSRSSVVMRSPGMITGIPGRYGVICSAAMRPIALSALIVSFAAKGASRGSITSSSSSSSALGRSTRVGRGKLAAALASAVSADRSRAAVCRHRPATLKLLSGDGR